VLTAYGAVRYVAVAMMIDNGMSHAGSLANRLRPQRRSVPRKKLSGRVIFSTRSPGCAGCQGTFGGGGEGEVLGGATRYARKGASFPPCASMNLTRSMASRRARVKRLRRFVVLRCFMALPTSATVNEAGWCPDRCRIRPDHSRCRSRTTVVAGFPAAPCTDSRSDT
jgi:hypothetical protein